MAIDTHGLRKVYGRTVAVEGVSLTVAAGEVFGFLGPNGAGKSTTVKMLTGLVHPTAGEARLFGRPIGDREVKRQLGFLPEHFRFPDWLTAAELLEFHGKLAGMTDANRKRRTRETLALVGLADRANDTLRTFSKGMLQRVGLAQALLADPSLVFLDEPTSALDPLGRREVRDIIHALKQKGTTVFLNSHLLSEIELVCDRVVIIDRGRVVREGNLTTLLDRHELEIRVNGADAGLLARLAEKYDVLSHHEGFLLLCVPDPDEVPLVADMIVTSGARLYGLSARKRSLEDLFAEAVERGSE